MCEWCRQKEINEEDHSVFLVVVFFHFGTVGGRVRPSGGSHYSNPTLGFSLLGNQPGSYSRGDGDRC